MIMSDYNVTSMHGQSNKASGSDYEHKGQWHPVSALKNDNNHIQVKRPNKFARGRMLLHKNLPAKGLKDIQELVGHNRTSKPFNRLFFDK